MTAAVVRPDSWLGVRVIALHTRYCSERGVKFVWWALIVCAIYQVLHAFR